MFCCFCTCVSFHRLGVNSQDNSELSFFFVCVSVIAHFVVGSAIQGRDNRNNGVCVPVGPGL